jgi:hypothetical protein
MVNDFWGFLAALFVGLMFGAAGFLIFFLYSMYIWIF